MNKLELIARDVARMLPVLEKFFALACEFSGGHVGIRMTDAGNVAELFFSGKGCDVYATAMVCVDTLEAMPEFKVQGRNWINKDEDYFQPYWDDFYTLTAEDIRQNLGDWEDLRVTLDLSHPSPWYRIARLVEAATRAKLRLSSESWRNHR